MSLQEGILYNREVINEGQWFWGMMSFADKALHNAFYVFAQDVGGKRAWNTQSWK